MFLACLLKPPLISRGVFSHFPYVSPQLSPQSEYYAFCSPEATLCNPNLNKLTNYYPRLKPAYRPQVVN